jgi:hypothetical protein
MKLITVFLPTTSKISSIMKTMANKIPRFVSYEAKGAAIFKLFWLRRLLCMSRNFHVPSNDFRAESVSCASQPRFNLTLKLQPEMNRASAISLAVAMSVFFLTQSAGAKRVIYTYTGKPFSYVGTGPGVTSVSGYFTVSSALAPNTTQNLYPDTVGGTITDYEFTDGRYILDIGNYATSDSFDNGTGPGTPMIEVTTGPDGHITSWYLNILSPTAYINSWNWPYDTLYGPSVADGVQADPSQAYDAYNGNSPGTWSVGTNIPPVAPEITSQPVNITASAGGTASLSVGASGYPLYYQWAFNGTNIIGATNATLALADLSAAQAGFYSVTVSNILGSVTSQPVILAAAWAANVRRFDHFCAGRQHESDSVRQQSE